MELGTCRGVQGFVGRQQSRRRLRQQEHPHPTAPQPSGKQRRGAPIIGNRHIVHIAALPLLRSWRSGRAGFAQEREQRLLDGAARLWQQGVTGTLEVSNTCTSPKLPAQYTCALWRGQTIVRSLQNKHGSSALR